MVWWSLKKPAVVLQIASWFVIILQNPHYILSSFFHETDHFTQLHIASYGSTIGTCQNSSFKHSWAVPKFFNTRFDESCVSSTDLLPQPLLFIWYCHRSPIVSFAFGPSSVKSRQEYLFWGTALAASKQNKCVKTGGWSWETANMVVLASTFTR